jgi:hypothetical protein
MTTLDVIIPEGVQIEVRGNPRHVAKHRTGAVFGPIFSDKKYFIHDSNLTNVKRGLVERVFRVRKDGLLVPPPRPLPGVFEERLRSVKQYLLSFPSLKPLSIRSVLNLWHGSKRKVYDRAADSLEVRPISRSDGWLKTFVKCEKIDASKGDPAPRVIQPRDPRYNLHVARFLKHNEHEIFRRIDQMFDRDGLGDKTVCKGMNAHQVASNFELKTSRFSDPVYIGLDASRFDQHVSVEALQWEHDYYIQAMAYDRSELSELLSWQRHNVGKAYLPEGTIKYEIDGCRASGDINTSLGNCLLMCSMVKAYCDSHFIRKYSLANNGDDCVVIVEKRDLHKMDNIPVWFEEMGFTMKVEEPVYELEKVEFCQTHVLRGDHQTISVRNPRIVLSKDLHSTHTFQHGEYLEWLSAVGECGMNSCRGVPVLEAFYSAFPTVEVVDKSIVNEMAVRYEYKFLGGSRQAPIDDTMRVSFWKAFGILPDAQVALENVLREVEYTDKLASVHSFPLVTYLQGCKPDKFTCSTR